MKDLSDLLRHLPLHHDVVRGSDFRSVGSVSRKTTDIATAHPDYLGVSTKGGEETKKVVRQFLDMPNDMKAAARAIREAARAGLFDSSSGSLQADVVAEEGYREGDLSLYLHARRDRDPRVKERKIAEVRNHGHDIECEICGFHFGRRYGERGVGFIECHHVRPLSEGTRETQISDVVLLCSNCHRMIHRGTPWLDPGRLRALLR